MKYIIEIDDKQLLEYDKETDTYFRRLYRAKGFNALVFDQSGLDKLTPLDKELEESYQKGLAVGYKDGYEDGQHEATTLDYQRGLDDVWEAAKKIFGYEQDGGLPFDDLRKAFGFEGVPFCTADILRTNTASEALAKLKAYEEKQKADEIKVGNEVCFVFAGGETIEPFIVFSIKDDNGKKYYEGIQTSDGRWVSGGLKYYKTGRHFPQVAELFKAIKGERSCSSCEYQNDPDGARCRDCCGYNKWEPKEGAE